MTNSTVDNHSLAIIVIVNSLLNVPLMLISVVGNSLVLVAVLFNSPLRSSSVILLCSLAVSDISIGLIVQPCYIAKEFTSSGILLELTATMGFAFCGVSFATMALISVDRLLALRYHIVYRTVVTLPRLVAAMMFIWLVHFIFLNKVWVPAEFLYAGVALIFLYIVAATTSYIGIYRIVRRHQRQIHVQHQAVQSLNTHASTTLKFLSLQRAAVNTFVFYICSIVCYFPWLIYRLCYGDYFVSNQKTGWIFTTTLVFANSSINPFLYGWRLRELRKGVLKILRKLCRKHSQGNRCMRPTE